jgi:cytochrome c553
MEEDTEKQNKKQNYDWLKGYQFVKGISGNPRGDWQFQEDRPNCIICGRKARYHTKNEDGSVKYWRNLCTMCHKNSGQEQYKYRLYKKNYCEICGFEAIHPVQLDVDHIDSNHKNNEEHNLMTLCANCHRLKTVMNGDHNGVEYNPYVN